MRHASELFAPWTVTNLSLRPFAPKFWAFNPSIHRDVDGTWRCILRNANYHAPAGVVRADPMRGGRILTRNVMLTLDPATWQPIASCEMRELDGRERNAMVSALGYEDLRLFRTERAGLCAIATSMQLRSDGRQEMVLLTLEPQDDFAIVAAEPIRGSWSDLPQKNWMPFDGALDVRLLYSVSRGLVFDDKGPIDGAPVPAEVAPERTSAQAPLRERVMFNGAVETRHLPRRIVHERAGDGPKRPPAARGASPGWTSPGLRGGSQLVSLGDDLWLGIAHDMRWAANQKHYWHVLFTCDGKGRMNERSQPFKLSRCGIEFAAGLAIDDDGDRVAISFGTEDQDAWIAATRLEAILEALAPVAPIVAQAMQTEAAS